MGEARATKIRDTFKVISRRGDGGYHAPELASDALRRACDPAAGSIDTTDHALPVDGIIGQPRATVALQFGLGMHDHGYHVFVAGPAGTGKMTAVNAYLAAAARKRPAPDDWCYVYNFADPERPRALRLPAGRGQQLARDLDHMLHVAQQRLPRAFDSDEYTGRREVLLKDLDGERERQFARLGELARAQGFRCKPRRWGSCWHRSGAASRSPRKSSRR